MSYLTFWDSSTSPSSIGEERRLDGGGFLSNHFGWDTTFNALIFASFCSAGMMVPPALADWRSRALRVPLIHGGGGGDGLAAGGGGDVLANGSSVMSTVGDLRDVGPELGGPLPKREKSETELSDRST